MARGDDGEDQCCCGAGLLLLILVAFAQPGFRSMVTNFIAFGGVGPIGYSGNGAWSIGLGMLLRRGVLLSLKFSRIVVVQPSLSLRSIF